MTLTLEDRHCARHKPTTTCIIVLNSESGPALPAPLASICDAAIWPTEMLKNRREPELPKASSCQANPSPRSLACKIMHPSQTGLTKGAASKLGGCSEIAKQSRPGRKITVLAPRRCRSAGAPPARQFASSPHRRRGRSRAARWQRQSRPPRSRAGCWNRHPRSARSAKAGRLAKVVCHPADRMPLLEQDERLVRHLLQPHLPAPRQRDGCAGTMSTSSWSKTRTHSSPGRPGGTATNTRSSAPRSSCSSIAALLFCTKLKRTRGWAALNRRTSSGMYLAPNVRRKPSETARARARSDRRARAGPPRFRPARARPAPGNARHTGQTERPAGPPNSGTPRSACSRASARLNAGWLVPNCSAARVICWRRPATRKDSSRCQSVLPSRSRWRVSHMAIHTLWI